MMLRFAIIALLLGLPLNAEITQDSTVLLWPDGAPQAKGDQVTDQPALTVHFPPKDKANGAAVVVNPGGGYQILASDHEGLQVARELNRHGITAFVLRYRLKPDYQPAVALLDGQRAIRYVRAHAKGFGIAPNRIGMLGFSAGGHLSAAVGTAPSKHDPDHADPVERVSSRPDFLAPIYPAISKSLFPEERQKDETWGSLEKQVTKDTPPTFLVHTHEDGLSPNHSVLFYQALLAHQVQAELHVFGKGPHGTGIAPGDPDLGQWPALLVNWMRRNGFLSSTPRQALKGSVTVNGKPLFWGWVTFFPSDDMHPVANAYMGWKGKGEFVIDAVDGPCLGKHRVEVYEVATEFVDPKSGAYSMKDAKRYETTIEITDSNKDALTVDVR